MASYLLILWVFTRAPIALTSAVRDTSAIFATLIALVILKEPFDRTVVLAVALATAGAVLIRLG
jgi:drug/metabolite transporter (DMT)-like permease